MTLNINAQPGDETRRNGDYVGLPHPDGEVRLSNVTVPKGTVVSYDGTDVAAVAGDNTDTVAGVVYEYDVFEDSPDPLVRGDRDATIKTHGAVVADLTEYVDGSATVAEGNALGPNGEVLILEEVDNGTNLYEVLVR
jgi:hypothetical protein